MRLNTDTEIESMSLTNHVFVVPSWCATWNWHGRLARFQRSRSLVLWHDHGTILHLGVHVAYDPALFEEYEVKTGCTSSLVETPTVYLLAAGSSSVEDQIAILQDRLDCLLDLSTEISSSNGVSICDKLHFFVGDHPAQQFERGTQQGGTWWMWRKMGDLAHAL